MNYIEKNRDAKLQTKKRKFSHMSDVEILGYVYTEYPEVTRSKLQAIDISLYMVLYRRGIIKKIPQGGYRKPHRKWQKRSNEVLIRYTRTYNPFAYTFVDLNRSDTNLARVLKKRGLFIDDIIPELKKYWENRVK